MDESLINLIKNSILNDYCKLMCIEAIEEQSTMKEEREIRNLMLYCIIYDMEYFVERIKKDMSTYKKEIDYIYMYYLESKNKQNVNLQKQIIENYNKKAKKIAKEIKTLSLINFDRKLLRYQHRKKGEDPVIKTSMKIYIRLDIIAECIKYKYLIKHLGLEDNKKIDKILNWNISVIKKTHTIEDKLWLI